MSENGLPCPVELWRILARDAANDRIPLVRLLGEWIKASVAASSQDCVLNLEAGAGTIALMLAEHVREVYCVEDWPRDLEQLTQRSEAHGPGNLIVLRASAGSLPFQGGKFDAVVWALLGAIEVDIRAGLTEAYRVVKPGGRVLLLVWDELRLASEEPADITWVVRVVRDTPLKVLSSDAREYALLAPNLESYRQVAGAAEVARMHPSRAKSYQRAASQLQANSAAEARVECRFAACIITAQRPVISGDH